MYAITANTNTLERMNCEPKLFINVCSFVDEPHYCLSPLLKSEFTEPLRHEPRYVVPVIQFVQDLQEAWAQLYLRYDSSTKTIRPRDGNKRAQVVPMPPEPIIAGPYTSQSTADMKLTRCCYLAGLIFHRAVVYLIPFTHPVNATDVDRLHKCMKSLDHSVCLMPYVHLWV